MVAFELLTSASKTPKATLLQEETKHEDGISFDTFLRSIAKKSVVLQGDTVVALHDPQTEEGPLVANTQEEKEMQTLLALLKDAPSDTKSKKKSSRLLSFLAPSKTKTKSLQIRKSDSDALSRLEKRYTLNPTITENTTVEELKALIVQAKRYLKDRVHEQATLASFTQTKATAPKTLKGLLSLAQKLDIDVESITLETIRNQTASQNGEKIPSHSSIRLQGKNDSLVDTITKQNTPVTPQEQEKTDSLRPSRPQDIPKTLTKKTRYEALAKLPSDTPLFKPVSTEFFSTNEMIQTKYRIEEEKHKPKTRTKTPLNLLLRPQKETTKLAPRHTQNVADLFASRHTAASNTILNALTPSQQSQNDHDTAIEAKEESLRDLLHHSDQTKKHAAQGLKSDALEVKLNEAKQMMRYLSQDIKKAIDEYKPPFSRVKVKLTPQKLGEIDLTVIQRGKNVHINLSSNNAALHILSNNLGELRTQLNHNGITNASFSFHSQSEHQHQEQQRGNKNAYTFETAENTQEDTDEAYAALEIIIPKYI